MLPSIVDLIYILSTGAMFQSERLGGHFTPCASVEFKCGDDTGARVLIPIRWLPGYSFWDQIYLDLNSAWI